MKIEIALKRNKNGIEFLDRLSLEILLKLQYCGVLFNCVYFDEYNEDVFGEMPFMFYDKHNLILRKDLISFVETKFVNEFEESVEVKDKVSFGILIDQICSLICDEKFSFKSLPEKLIILLSFLRSFTENNQKIGQLKDILQIVEQRLSSNPFLFGELPTGLDARLGATLIYLNGNNDAKEIIAKFDNISSYISRTISVLKNQIPFRNRIKLADFVQIAKNGKLNDENSNLLKGRPKTTDCTTDKSSSPSSDLSTFVLAAIILLRMNSGPQGDGSNDTTDSNKIEAIKI